MSGMCRFIIASALCSICRSEDFRVRFDVETEGGEQGFFVIKVTESWAPIGAARFKELVEAQFYDNTRFFRVLPGFIVQFGISGDPEVTKNWQYEFIKDDPVTVSNKQGYITFAKMGLPDSRTTQLFINYVNNSGLDSRSFAPFGEVEGDGMDVVRKIHDCGEKPDQKMIQNEGNVYLDKEFPQLSKITMARVLGVNASVDVDRVAEKSTAASITLLLFLAAEHLLA
eukprot:gnl/TRDRNA2_/TRDRNA2_204588_c0_seq1.p1 gnl/TRDRNA2_/TRDRNA2_204588_c0~~gnl/TRDRNA2_/TRDRNA2_204588_c0_seq1.p1  ORF type:complete len:227 (-),score=27.98 gnl/TRDRNA2_/TRDRNA2_204588_c0_seq1:219-899(-)